MRDILVPMSTVFVGFAFVTLAHIVWVRPLTAEQQRERKVLLAATIFVAGFVGGGLGVYVGITLARLLTR